MVKMNQYANYLPQRSFSSKVNVQTYRHTHQTNGCIWATKLVSYKC